MSYANHEFNYVYVLRDPRTKKVHYVGTTVNPQSRLWQHMSMQYPGNVAKNAWIRDLIDHGLKPELLVVEECQHIEAFAAEKRWIEDLIQLGHPLVNLNNIPVDK